MVLLQRKLYFSKDPEGVQLFPGGGGATFTSGGGGLQKLISIETHMTCDFPGGGGPDPHIIPRSGYAHAQYTHIKYISLYREGFCNYMWHNNSCCNLKMIWKKNGSFERNKVSAQMNTGCHWTGQVSYLTVGYHDFT